jgi:type IV secretory pathway VirB10-like protein
MRLPSTRTIGIAGVGLSLGVPAAAALGAPKGVWIGIAIAAALCLVAALAHYLLMDCKRLEGPSAPAIQLEPQSPPQPPPEPEPLASIMEATEAPQPVFPPAPAAAAGNAEQHIETRREAARTTGAQSEHQRDQEASTPPSGKGNRAGRREVQGRELLLRLAELRIRATMLSFTIEPAIEFNDLLAESERWVGSSRNAPRAVSTTPTGGRLTLPPDWFSDADFARLKAYLEEHMRRLQR